jgi:hypothetical protein
MPKLMFNEAERYLLKNWSDARSLEESMKRVREKYTGLCEKVAEAVKTKHPELDLNRVGVTLPWGHGFLFSSPTAWEARINDGPGFLITNLGLEVLGSDDEPPPRAAIWIKPARKAGVDLAQARKALVSAAETVLTPEERDLCLKERGDRDSVLFYDLPETRQQLLEMLLEGDAQRFVDCMVSHIELLARFTPALDKILLKTE